jgi:hypothetical protein
MAKRKPKVAVCSRKCKGKRKGAFKSCVRTCAKKKRR